MPIFLTAGNEDHLRKLIVSHSTSTHSGLCGVWLYLMMDYFPFSDDFIVVRESDLPKDKKADVIVTKLKVGNAPPSSVIVIEVKPEKSQETWENITRQITDYVKLINKRSNDTVAILVKGNQFKLYRIKGREHGFKQEWIDLGCDNDGTNHIAHEPYDIFNNREAFHTALTLIRQQALEGQFTNN